MSYLHAGLVGALMFAACTGSDPDLESGTSSGGTDGGGGQDGGGCASDTPAACGPSCAVCAAPSGGGRATCNAGACGIECDAPKTACGDACVDLAIDADNCGRCARKCGAGSSCTDGRCATQMVADVASELQEIVLAGANLYFTTPRDIQRVAKAGGAVVTFQEAGNPQDPHVVDPHSLEADSLKLYWGGRLGGLGQQQGIFEQALASTVSTQIVKYPDGSPALPATVKGNLAAWSHLDGNALNACEPGAACIGKTAGDLSRLDLGTSGLTFLAISGASIVWTQNSGFVSVSPAKNQQYVLAQSPAPFHLVVFKDVVYWTDLGVKEDPMKKPGVWTCKLSGCDGTPVKLVEWDAAPSRLAVDDTGVYFSVPGDTSQPTGAIVACQDIVKGCTGALKPQILVKDAEHPDDIEIDDAEVFFVTRPTSTSGKILRVAK